MANLYAKFESIHSLLKSRIQFIKKQIETLDFVRLININFTQENNRN